MAITVKHSKVSTIPDDADTSLVRPSDWNADHTLIGLGTAAELDAGVPNGVATLDAGGKVPVSELPAAVLGALSYQGTWNASTNTPTLTSSVGTKGYYYVVSVAGSTNLDGITDWLVGDWAVYNGTIWQKVDNTETVTSVNGQTGAVVLTASSVGAVPTTRTITAGTGLTGGGDLSADRTFAIDSTVATLTGTQTLTNKTLTSPKVNEILDANGNEVLGLLSTASATDYVAIKNGIGIGVPLHISSEGSSANIGLHIQPKGTGLVTISDGTDFNKGIRFRSSGSAASAITLLDAVSTAGHVITLPDATTTLVGRGTTDTLTNKSISGSTNTLSNIGNASLTNSTITINGNSTALGGSVSVGTVTSVDLTASTGISVSGGPITGSGSITVTNTAPDQTVAIASGTGISVTGTYPNFTVTNTAPSSGGTVTSVTGTAPVVSSGGNTPAISMAAATTSVNGYLTSTDWNTFNSKGNGTVTSVGGTGTVSGISLSGTVTSSGNLTLGGTLDLSSPPAIGGTTPAAGNFTTLGATGVATFSAGTVSAPAITTTGDTNTGIFFPAADTIAFTEGGVESMRINSSGTVVLASGSGLSISATGVTSPATADGNVFSGTYTPTQVSTNSNVDSVTFTLSHYMRVGAVVTVGGQITIDATLAATDTIVRMSLPIASNFTSSRTLGGTGSCITGSNYGIQNIAFLADSTNDCAELRLRPSVLTSLIYNYSFTYQVV